MSDKNTTDDETSTPWSRRQYVRTAALTGTVGATGFAGCLSSDDDLGEGEGGEDNETGGDGPAGEGELEIIHWWTAGGEEEAFNALVEGFQEEHGDVEVTPNPAPGGAGSAQDATIQNRLLSDNPPSTFQIWPGEALRPYLDADRLESLEDTVWTDEMREAYIDGVVDVAQPDGELVSVPLNIHRLNNLFYNVEVVEAAGVDPSTIETPGDLTDAMATIASETDATPMAHQTQQPWSAVQLWETIFIGEQGADAFVDLTDGNVEAHEDGVRSALNHLVDYADYYPEDAGSISWDQGNTQVINGDAAFIHQGDWAAGQYEAAGDFEFETNWDMVPFPGTDGVYSIVVDSFVYPSDNPTPEETELFLQYCGTVDAQRRFNPIKGSIPPRTDVPTDEFGPFLVRQIEDFDNSTAQPPTIGHGTAVEPEAKSNIEETFAAFNENLDVDQAYEGIRGAF
ncbi:ABC transporter substrate-binding protein [Haloferacaceae archaeon DSL9]